MRFIILSVLFLSFVSSISAQSSNPTIVGVKTLNVDRTLTVSENVNLISPTLETQGSRCIAEITFGFSSHVNPKTKENLHAALMAKVAFNGETLDFSALPQTVNINGETVNITPNLRLTVPVGVVVTQK